MSLLILAFVLVISRIANAMPIESNPEEAGKFEGDMLLDEVQLMEQDTRNGVKDLKRRWIHAEVPYLIQGSFTVSQISTIKRAFAEYHEKTCVRFVEKTPDHKNWIEIKNDQSGCFSNVGKLTSENRANTVNLDNWCFKRFGTILHEFAHALGFYHEQSRFDRDDFVTIVFANIENRYRSNFKRYTDSDVMHFGAPYDFDSMMHYGPTAFSTNGKKTIVTKDPNANIGQRAGFSIIDLFKINSMYECEELHPLPAHITWPATPWPDPIIPTPPPQIVSGLQFTCDFDTDKCGFADDPLLTLDWQLKSGATPTPSTGPDGDHTTGTGNYMYMETSGGQANDLARLLSPRFTTAGGRCLRFWYHMYGKSMGNLRVFHLSGDEKTEIWQAAGNHGNIWLSARKFVNMDAGDRLIFEGQRGDGYQSDMAFDDVEFNGATEDSCRDPVVVSTPSPQTDPDVISYCNFDTSGCSYLKNTDFEGNWLRHKGKTPSPGTGPSADVSKLVLSKAEGYYMYIEASNYNHGDRAGLISQPFTARSDKTCISFYYHMYAILNNDPMGTLEIYVKGPGDKTQSLLKRTGNKGDFWFHEKHTITGQPNDVYKLYITGTVGSGYASDMAVDEIKIRKGEC